VDLKGGVIMYKFKGYCVENGIKQKELAKLLGLSISVVNQKMNGRLDWTLEQVKTICKHYGISADIYFV
jgi:antitoxin component HigA of HigAB toxin-antitoxin module